MSERELDLSTWLRYLELIRDGLRQHFQTTTSMLPLRMSL